MENKKNRESKEIRNKNPFKWTDDFIHEKFKYIILIAIIVIAILVMCYSLRIYWIQFHKYNFSDDPQIWGVFGDYLGGTLNPLLTIISITITIWLTIAVNKLANSNTEKQIEAERRIACIHLRHEALKEFRSECIRAFSDLKGDPTPDNIGMCLKILENFETNNSHLFDFENLNSYKKLLERLKEIKTHSENGLNKTEEGIDLYNIKVAKQNLLSELSKVVLEE